MVAGRGEPDLGRPGARRIYKVFRNGGEDLDLDGSLAQSVILMLLMIALTVFLFRYRGRRVQ